MLVFLQPALLLLKFNAMVQNRIFKHTVKPTRLKFMEYYMYKFFNNCSNKKYIINVLLTLSQQLFEKTKVANEEFKQNKKSLFLIRNGEYAQLNNAFIYTVFLASSAIYEIHKTILLAKSVFCIIYKT